jgi:hypothetical protein
MCGRYASFLPAEAVARLFHTTNRLPNFPPTCNIAPRQDAMVVRHHPETGERHLDLLKWGLLPYFTKDPAHAKRSINARAETVATSGMFKSAFARRRCIVPADAFYEWKPIEGGHRCRPRHRGRDCTTLRRGRGGAGAARSRRGAPGRGGEAPARHAIAHHRRGRDPFTRIAATHGRIDVLVNNVGGSRNQKF